MEQISVSFELFICLFHSLLFFFWQLHALKIRFFLLAIDKIIVKKKKKHGRLFFIDAFLY